MQNKLKSVLPNPSKCNKSIITIGKTMDDAEHWFVEWKEIVIAVDS